MDVPSDFSGQPARSSPEHLSADREIKLKPYAPRKIAFHGLRQPRDWQLKLYSIVFGSTPIEWDDFAPGLSMAEAMLPEPNADRGRPGVGFLIAHRGPIARYIILGWWDRENEVPLRVLVRSEDSRQWHPATDGESVCVWDLEVVWAERNAYVATMLKTETPDLPGYLASTMDSITADDQANPAIRRSGPK